MRVALLSRTPPGTSWTCSKLSARAAGKRLKSRTSPKLCSNLRLPNQMFAVTFACLCYTLELMNFRNEAFGFMVKGLG